jgi:hypothetical protein
MKKILALFLMFAVVANAQQPQCPTCPTFAANAKYVNGTAPGYAPKAGTGLTLNLSAGRVRCANTMTNYAGGTLTLANNTTNYVFLDTASSCAPSSNTSGYTTSLIALATVITSSGVITTITDDRTFGLENKLAGTGTVTVASGTSAMGTSGIGSGACATVVTTSATGVATTDNIMADFNADPTGVTGYAPSGNGILTIIKYPTANNVNFKVCNNTGASITPGAVTLNWRVVR